MDNDISEKKVQNQILLEFGCKPYLRIWRHNVGVAVAEDRMVRFGQKGHADISGIIYPNGRRLEIEVKKPKGGRQKESQKKFQAMIEKFGGVYILARSVQDVYDGLKKIPELQNISLQ